MTALSNAMIKKDKTISHNLRQFLATTMLANYLTNVTTVTGTEVKNNYCLFLRLFEIRMNGVLRFEISSFVMEILRFL